MPWQLLERRSELPDAGVEVETSVSWCRHTHRLTYTNDGRWWAIVGVAYVTHTPERWRYLDVGDV